MKIGPSTIQQHQQKFMETFARVLDDEEENRLHEQAFDTFLQQSTERAVPFEKLPTLLAAHAYNTARSSLSELMPEAALSQIRKEAGEQPEIAKWVSLLDASTQFLNDVNATSPGPTSAGTAAPSTLFQESPAFDDNLAQVKTTLSQAQTISQRSTLHYESAAQNAESSSESAGQAGRALADRAVDAALGLGQSAEASGRKASEASESGIDGSYETEQLIASASYLVQDRDVSRKLKDLLNLCERAQAKGREGQSDISDAAHSLRLAMSDARFISEAPKGSKLALEFIEAGSKAYESESDFSRGAYDFEDAGREQNKVSQGLQELLVVWDTISVAKIGSR